MTAILLDWPLAFAGLTLLLLLGENALGVTGSALFASDMGAGRKDR
jgi:hypothetical protein